MVDQTPLFTSDALATARNKAGLSQEKLAERVGSKRATIFNWENNPRVANNEPAIRDRIIAFIREQGVDPMLADGSKLAGGRVRSAAPSNASGEATNAPPAPPAETVMSQEKRDRLNEVISDMPDDVSSRSDLAHYLYTQLTDEEKRRIDRPAAARVLNANPELWDAILEILPQDKLDEERTKGNEIDAAWQLSAHVPQLNAMLEFAESMNKIKRGQFHMHATQALQGVVFTAEARAEQQVKEAAVKAGVPELVPGAADQDASDEDTDEESNDEGSEEGAPAGRGRRTRS